MKILFLNVWNAALEGPLIAYVREEMKDTDVFCFQEFFEDTADIAEMLNTDFFEIHARKENDAGHTFAQSTFIRKELPCTDSWSDFSDMPGIGFGLWTNIQEGDRIMHICNYHGYALPGNKKDTKERIFASESLIGTTKTHEGISIIGGDFNLDIETRSVNVFSDYGFRDLVAEYRIDTTRNRHVWDLYPVKMYYSDYVFVRGGAVKDFVVPKNEVSDHLPLIVKI